MPGNCYVWNLPVENTRFENYLAVKLIIAESFSYRYCMRDILKVIFFT